MLALPTVAPLLVAIYCLSQALRDFRRRAYIMAMLGIACALVVLTVLAAPIPTHAVGVALPVADPRQAQRAPIVLRTSRETSPGSPA